MERATARIGIGDDGQAVKVEPSSLDELMTAIRELKNDKAVEKNELPTEVTKVICENQKNSLLDSSYKIP